VTAAFKTGAGVTFQTVIGPVCPLPTPTPTPTPTPPVAGVVAGPTVSPSGLPPTGSSPGLTASRLWVVGIAVALLALGLTAVWRREN